MLSAVRREQRRMAHQSEAWIRQVRAAQARAARQPEELDWAQARRVPAQKAARVTLPAAQAPRSVAPEA